mgnify:CR=1 FL=1
MADRRPLIVNSNAQQIQELAVSDGLIGNGTFPLGGIIMWSGAISAIPTGWSLCDGSNGTPDLRNKFVLGATNDGSDGTYPGISVSQTGGSANATLVSHTHTATVNDDGHAHTQTGGGTDDDGGPNVPGGNSGSTISNINNNTTGITVSNSTEGSSATNANLPPFLALAYIQRTS